MHKLTFYPLGNADCCCIDLDNGRKMLIDYAAKKNLDDEDDLRCDLPTMLRNDLEDDDRDNFDVVAITHLDDDHFRGASDFFWFDHAKKYQGDDRIKIKTLWVPAAVITEQSVDDAEARVIQKEARYRFSEGVGIRVFSRPERLKDWCKESGVSLNDRMHLITDAGKVATEFSLDRDGVEFFVHSPFAKRLNGHKVEDRNADSIVLQGTFRIEDVDTRVLLLADTPHENLSDIISITKNKKRPERLQWDVAKLPHHCSYLSLGPEKGRNITDPTDEVAWLWEEQGQNGAMIISTSKPVPRNGSKEDEDNNPPHRQAAKYYEDVIEDLDGQFVVTMEHPKPSKPLPIVIEIDRYKATLQKSSVSATSAASNTRSPRAG